MHARLGAGLLGFAGIVACSIGTSKALAQAEALPPVTVDAPKSSTATSTPKRTGAASTTKRRRAAARSRTTAPAAAVADTGTRSRETATGPVAGYVATRSAAGTKTDTPLLETPQSISVVSREQMRDQAVQTFSEALRYTPGVVAEEYGGTYWVEQYMVRGFSNSFPYLDGLTTNSRYTLLAPTIDPYGLERTEVLRGPASVLYGQNVPGGLVNLVSKRPSDTPINEVQIQAGDPAGAQTAFDFSGPIDKDGTLLYRLTGLARSYDTQIDNVDAKRYFIAPAFTWKPSTDTTFTILANLQHSEGGVLTQNLPAVGTLYPASFGKIPTNFFAGEPDLNTSNTTSESVGYSFEHRFDEVWTVRQNLRYYRDDLSGSSVGTSGYDASSSSTLDRYTLAEVAHQTIFAVDNQAQAKFDTFGVQHTALLGVDYYHSSDRWVEWDGSASSLNVLAPIYGRPFSFPTLPDYATNDTISQVGVYAQDQIKWNRFVFTGGLRQDWADTATNENDTSAVLATSQHDKDLTGRAGLVYLFDNGIAPYVSYSTSFLPTVGVDEFLVPFKPTTAKQEEVGVKYQPTGSKSFVMLSAFNIVEDNVLTPDPNPANINNQVQTGQIRVRGIEASATAQTNDGWKLIASYSFLDGEITADNSGDVGNRPKDVPHHLANLWVDKTIQTGLLAGFGAGGGLRYVGDHYGDNANTLLIPGTLLVDAALHYDYRNWRFQVNAKNLFDKSYVATCDNAEFCYYGLRRTVLGTMTYHW
jgi:iron complex outermembrane recepter protein